MIGIGKLHSAGEFQVISHTFASPHLPFARRTLTLFPLPLFNPKEVRTEA